MVFIGCIFLLVLFSRRESFGMNKVLESFQIGLICYLSKPRECCAVGKQCCAVGTNLQPSVVLIPCKDMTRELEKKTYNQPNPWNEH